MNNLQMNNLETEAVECLVSNEIESDEDYLSCDLGDDERNYWVGYISELKSILGEINNGVELTIGVVDE